MSVERLQALAVDNLLTGLEMAEEAGRFERLALRHEQGTAPRAVVAFNLFQTPVHVAETMARMIADHVGPGARILEPSAGLGRLYSALVLATDPGALVLVESSADCTRELYALSDDDQRTTLKESDFLETTAAGLGGRFDAVCMNPPFKMGRDIKHILHAADMLKTGGLLVALCYDGVHQNKKLRPLCDTWTVLPADTFKSEGTKASVALVTIRR